MKTQIEIVVDKKIITQGMKIEATHAALLFNLKIQPFNYKMHMKKVYEDDQTFNREIIDINSADILKRLRASCFSTANSFDPDHSFKKADKMKNATKKELERSVICSPHAVCVLIVCDIHSYHCRSHYRIINA